MERSSWTLLLCSLAALGSVAWAYGASNAQSLDEAPLHRAKRARGMVMFGKRPSSDVASSSSQGVDKVDEKRPFGWNTYQWGSPQSELALDGGADGGNKRKFLFGKRQYDELTDAEALAAGDADDMDKRARTFSFGKRFGQDDEMMTGEDLDKRKFLFGKRQYDELTDAKALAAGDVDDMDKRARTFSFGKRFGTQGDNDDDSLGADKRARTVMFGKRPFGVGSHHWGMGLSDLGEQQRDESGLQDKRIFKFGKRVADI